MLRRAWLFTIAALTFGSAAQVIVAPSADAEPRGVATADGLTVFQESVARADGGTGTLLIARVDPKRMTTRVVEANDAPPADAPWSVTINGSYFNEGGTPLYHLRDGVRVLAPFRKGTNAVFWCRDGRCAIQHSSDFDSSQPYDIAVQAAPRLMGKGEPTKGVRGADVVDGRAGLAITADGEILVFATSPLKWGGLTFNGIREFLTENFGSESILMLDGGNSARMSIRIGERAFGNGPFSRTVPYSIRFVGR